MSDHSDLRCLFDQPNLNFKQARRLATISEFDFEIIYIKGKENKVADDLSKRVQVNHNLVVSPYRTYLQEQILHVRQHDEQYQQYNEYHLTECGLVRFKNMIYVPYSSEAYLEGVSCQSIFKPPKIPKVFDSF